jgi:chloramphenicol 3-O phosphotransferase
MLPGKIIFLNGSSSAGKTTLAHALQEVMHEPWMHVALDQFRDGMPARFRGLNAPHGTDGERGLNVVPVSQGDQRYTEVRFGETGKPMLRGMRRAIAAMVHEGNNVIIDDILLEPSFLDDYLEVFAGLTVYFIGVKCPADVVDARERQRPGRFPGTATGHLTVVHRHGLYDVEVDTSVMAPHECALKVQQALTRHQPEAFRALLAKPRQQRMAQQQ